MNVQINDDLNVLEEERKAINQVKASVYAFTFIIGAILSIMLQNYTILIFIIPIGIVLSIVFTNSRTSKFKSLYKRIIILEIFKKLFSQYTYNPEQGFSYELIKKLDLFEKADRYISSDYIHAEYQNIEMQMSDIDLTKIVRRGKHSKRITIFKGQWYIFNFNKQFKSEVQILDSSFIYTNRHDFFDSKFNKIETENVEFNKNYFVFTKNDFEAFYILTPQIIEKLNEFKKRLNCQVLFVFKDNKLHIGVNSHRDYFEPDMDSPMNINAIEQKTLQEINVIINLIKDLNLEKNLFRKEV